MSLEVKFKKLRPEAVLPSKANESDAAYDLTAVAVEIMPRYISYKLGFSTEIPVGWCAKIYPRSSISNYDLVQANSVGIVDAGYRGEWEVRHKIGVPIVGVLPELLSESQVKESSEESLLYKAGDRVAQVVFEKTVDAKWIEQHDLQESERGEGGFGSSGT